MKYISNLNYPKKRIFGKELTNFNPIKNIKEKSIIDNSQKNV